MSRRRRVDRLPSREERRNQFSPDAGGRRRRGGVSWNALIIAAALALLAVAILRTGSGSSGAVLQMPGVDAAEPVPTGQDLALPVAAFADGRARFYRYITATGRDVRFFVMRSSDGVVRAAFDSCDVCFRERLGYRQAGDTMICNNCGQTFPSRSINVLQGGCNPAPIARTVQGGHVVLRAAALEEGAQYF